MTRSKPALIAGLIALPLAGRAEPTRNVEASLYDPTPTTLGTSFQLQPAQVGVPGAYVLSSTFSYANNPVVLGTVQNDDPVIARQAMLSLGGAYALAGKFELGAHIPLYFQSGQAVQPNMFTVPPASGAAVGDTSLHGKMQLSHSEAFTMGIGLGIKLPTRTDGQLTGSNLPSARVLALMTYVISPHISLAFNGGGVIRKPADFANISQGSGATAGLGAQFHIRDPLFLHVEAFGDLIPGGYKNEMGETSLLGMFEALAGARYLVSREASLGLAVGRGLTSSFGTPDIRGVLTFAYAPSAPVLPSLYHPELPPPPPDLTKEDTDFDRIVDAKDKCPEYPEDKDGFEDDDGCPDPDNDKDGILDKADKCPMQAEDKDGFEDEDGCPELDNDKDGIADKDDKCPTKPEKINGNEDNDGCPDTGDSLVVSQPERIELLENVAFNGPGLGKGSANLLGQLAATLRARADIGRVRISVHVQPTKFPDKDKVLADKRADAVREWLVQWGIAAERLDVKGYGGTKPLVPPTQKGAAEINDRIELIILERK